MSADPFHDETKSNRGRKKKLPRVVVVKSKERLDAVGWPLVVTRSSRIIAESMIERFGYARVANPETKDGTWKRNGRSNVYYINTNKCAPEYYLEAIDNFDFQTNECNVPYLGIALWQI